MAIIASVVGEPSTAGASTALPPSPRLTAPQGTLVLPNLDDDTRRCTLRPGDLDRLDVAVDTRLASCNDAADDIVNGPRDMADLTPVRLAPMKTTRHASGRISVPTEQGKYVRIFVRRAGTYVSLGSDGQLTASELRHGAQLAVEGRDIVRDPKRWDGRISLTLTVTKGQDARTAHLALHIAPVLLQNDLQRAQQVFAAAPGPGKGQPVEVPAATRQPGQWRQFADSLRKATRAAGMADRQLTFQKGTSQWWRDIWRQDIVEPAYVTRPTPNGPHTLRILLRSPNYWTSHDGRSASLRRAGRLLFRDLRGPDIGIVQQYTTHRDPNVDELLNFTGNIESLPPYDGFPHGRILYGSSAQRHPDPSFTRMLRAQGQQPPVVLDTSWLVVGHADETVHVLRADNARGWTLAVSDPRLAVDLLRRAQRAGEGGQRLFAGTEADLKPTIDEYLRMDATRGDNEYAARHLDEQLKVLLRATGLRPQDIIRLPVLYMGDEPGGGLPRRYIAASPALANGLSLSARDYAAPDPHGPRVTGHDLFREEAGRRLAAQGVRVRWVEDFSWAHMVGGEVHCATNALRDVP
ncbi:protein-arginine deiminase family protein [Streptomyces filipinensis]|uniref:protein-arginine deiminase family protein n=1 Tax=Streptomyces filipinensis TaxID=66887 RepID=UPI0036E74493